MKKMIAPILIAVILLLFLTLQVSGILYVIISELPNLIVILLVAIIALVLAASIIAVLIQRIKEIKEEDEDDLSKY